MILKIKEKRFGDKLVLENINLEIPEGEKIAFLGPSGIGKTTLIRIISGLDKSFTGKLENPFSNPVVLFQEDRLIDSLSLRANLKAVSDDDLKLDYFVKAVGLENEMKTCAGSLSGGMRRRLSLIRALLLEGDVLILDEPFRGMDDILKERVSSLIIEETKAKTLILVTHSEDEAKLLNINRLFVI